MRPVIFLILYSLAFINTSYAGDTSGKYPSVLLVQLRSEHNRIDAMTNDRKFKEAAEVKNDAMQVQTKMILDFTADFHYCPVYYYIDTNADLIKNKKFKGVLMNADSSLVTDPLINNQSDDYVIVYFGYALSQSRSTSVVTDSDKYTYDPDSRPGKGLVILNDQFRQISYIYKFGYDNLIFRHKKNVIERSYVSKHYDIEYYPLAKLLNDKLAEKRKQKKKIKSATYHTN